jgi:hypothetical protein
MITAQQYRAKAAEYAALAGTANSPSQRREFRALERNNASWAANEEWLAGNNGHCEPAPGKSGARTEADQILASLGAAVIMRWDTLPKKIQRELFEHAGSIAELRQATEAEGVN